MTEYEPDRPLQQATEQLLRQIVADPTLRVAICDHCGWPFVIAAKDLACCRELQARRAKNPATMSPQAGAVLCPLDEVLTYQDQVAVRKMRAMDGVGALDPETHALIEERIREQYRQPTPVGDIVDEVMGSPAGQNQALFLDWLRKHGGID